MAPNASETTSPPLDPALTGRIHALWDHLADFDAARTEEALLFVMRQLKALVDADDAVWIGTVRMAHGKTAENDHQLGWRGRVVAHLDWTDLKREVVAAAMKAQEIDGGVPSFSAMVKKAGTFRTVTLRELHDMETFMKTEHYRSCFVPFGITDRMWCVFPVNEDCEIAYILDRCGDRPLFTAADKAAVATTLRALKWFHRATVLTHGVLLGDRRLTPRERSLCVKLLGPHSEKEIAASLGLTFATTHGYVQTIYRKFGVQGRTGLMALWLGGSKEPASRD